MAASQYVYHMQGVSKTYPGGKKCFENIHLSFLPGVKIGVVGVNGAGKSTLMKIMAGIDKEFQGEAWSAEGAKVGYLPQEPELDETISVRENVMLGVAEKKEILDRSTVEPGVSKLIDSKQPGISKHFMFTKISFSA